MGEERKRATTEEVQLMVSMYAALNTIRLVLRNERMLKRIKTIPYGMRDMTMMRAVLDKVAWSFLDTLPEEKRDILWRQMQSMRYMTFTGQMADPPRDMMYTDTKMFDDLAVAAHQQCQLCDHQDRCKSCKIGKALDAHMPFSRGKSWAYIDLEAAINRRENPDPDEQ